MIHCFDRAYFASGKAGRILFIGILILGGAFGAPSFAADDVASQNAAQMPASSADDDIAAIKKQTEALFNEQQNPLASEPPSAPGIVEDAPPAVTPTPSAITQNADDEAIKNNVYRLYSETLSGPAVSPQPPVQPQPAAQVVATPAVDALPTATPAPAVTQPAALPVQTPVAVAAPPLAPSSPPALAPVVAPAAVAPVPPPASPPVVAVASAKPVATTAVANGTAAKKAGAPLPVEVKLAQTAPMSPPAALAQPRMMNNDTTSNGGFSDEHAADFIRNLAGAEGVPLNVVDAVTPADVQTPMHLDEAVAFALKNNFEAQAAGEKSSGAYWDKMGAYSEYLPNIALSADTGPERSQPGDFNDAFGNRVLDNTHNRQDHSITVTQPLIDLGIISDILSGTDKQDIADIDERDVREGLAFDTASTYLNLLQSRISIRLADDYRGYLNDLERRMQARVTGGGATSADLDRIRGRETTAESARIEALGEYESDLADFKRLTKIMPAQLVIPVVLAPAVPGSEETAMKEALKDNPSYISSLKKVDLAEDDRNKSFSGLLPKLSGQYSNSYSFNAGGAAEGNPVDGVYPIQKTQTVMLVAQWSLSGGTSIAGGLSGIAKEREMDLRSLDIRARIEQGIRTGYAAINAAHQREGVLQRSVDDDVRVVKSFEAQYKAGGRSLFDMLDAYEQLYNARLNLMRVVIAEAKAAYQVRRQMGELQQSILASEGR